MGLNFYGYDFSHGEMAPVVGHRFLEILAMDSTITWHSEFAEHQFSYISEEQGHQGETHDVWYPTLESISQRLKLAEQFGMGISIWEIAQGLDYFYDLL